MDKMHVYVSLQVQIGLAGVCFVTKKKTQKMQTAANLAADLVNH